MGDPFSSITTPADTNQARPFPSTYADFMDISDAVIGSREFIEYSVPLEATGTNPSLGSNGRTELRVWRPFSKLVFFAGFYRFGSPSDPGSGTYFVRLPHEASSNLPTGTSTTNLGTVIGSCIFHDANDTESSRNGQVFLATSTQIRFARDLSPAGAQVATHSGSGYTGEPADEISFTCWYLRSGYDI